MNRFHIAERFEGLSSTELDADLRQIDICPLGGRLSGFDPLAFSRTQSFSEAGQLVEVFLPKGMSGLDPENIFDSQLGQAAHDRKLGSDPFIISRIVGIDN